MSSANSDDAGSPRPRGRPRIPRQIHVIPEPRTHVDPRRLAHVLHGIYEREHESGRLRQEHNEEADDNGTDKQ